MTTSETLEEVVPKYRAFDTNTLAPMPEQQIEVWQNALAENALGKYRNILSAILTVRRYNFRWLNLDYWHIAAHAAEISNYDPRDVALALIRLAVPDFEKPKDIRVCPECGEEIDVADYWFYDLWTGKAGNADSLLNMYDPNYAPVIKVAPDNEDNFWHADCAEMNGLVLCDQCGRFEDEDNITRYDGEKYCDSCADEWLVSCADCGDIVHREDARYTHDYGYVCETCYDRNYFTCDSCGEIYCIDERYVHGDDWLCERCYENVDEDYDDDCEGYVHSYGWKPNGNFYQDDGTYKTCCVGDDLYYGFELEVSGSQRFAPDFLDFFASDEKQLYLKSDCSIIGGGFEIVTHPMTYDYIHNHFAETLRKGLDALKSRKFKGHNKGGMHVHMSRRAFTYDQWCRMVRMMDAEENEKAWLFLTQRKLGNLEDWAHLNMLRRGDIYSDRVGTDKGKKLFEERQYMNSGTRYCAINSTPNTIEFRIFNSNLRIERVLKNIEVCQSLYDFTAQTRSDNPKITTYINYVRRHKDKYPNLVAFLKEKDWDTNIAEAFANNTADADTNED